MMFQALSENAIKQLFAKGVFTDMSIIVQLLSFEQMGDTKKNLIEYFHFINCKQRAIISDGFSKNKVILIESQQAQISAEFTQTTSFKPIIRIKGWKSNEDICLIRDFEILIRNYTKQIGQPIEYREFVNQNYQNPKGSSVIQQIEASASQVNSNQKRPQITMKIIGKSNDTPQQPQISQQSQDQFQLQGQSQIQSIPSSHQKLSLKQQQSKPKSIVQVQNSVEKQYQFISNLHPLINDFFIKARIIAKSQKKEFPSNRNRNEKNQVFSIDILDEQGSSITCAFFGNACNKFYDLVEVGSVYKFSGGTVKVQQKKYTNTTSDYQIVFEEYSLIQKLEDDEQIQSIQLNLLEIRDIKQKQVNDLVDVLGIVKENTTSTQQTTKNGSISRRSFHIFDASKDFIYVSLWGALADKFQLKKDDIVCFKSMIIREFNGEKQLTSGNQGSLILANELENNEKYQNLLSWLQNIDHVQFQGNESQTSLPLKYCSEIEEIVQEQINKMQDLNNFKLFTRIRVFLVAFTSNSKFVYPACEKCSKKLSNETGSWKCESCNKEYQTPNYRYVIQGKFSDMTGSIWLTIHDGVAQTILGIYGISGNDFEKLEESKKQELIKKNNFKEYNLQILSKIENYQGNWKGKHQILKIVESDYLSDVKELFDQLTQN